MMETVYVFARLKDESLIEENLEPDNKNKENLIEFVLRMCRKHGLIQERITFLSPSDFLQVLQLCHARMMKKMGKDFQEENAIIISQVAPAVCVHKLKRAIADVCRSLKNTVDNHSKDTENSNTDAFKQIETNLSENVQVIPEKVKLKVSTLEEISSETGSDVLNIEKIVIEYEDFLSNSNLVDAIDVLKIFALETQQSNSEPESALCTDLASHTIDISGHPMDPLQELIVEQLQNCEATKENSVMQQCIDFCCSEKTPVVKSLQHWAERSHPPSVESETDAAIPAQNDIAGMMQALVRELFHSYMNLLVNSRSELSLARVFNVPERGLTHQAFTHLKHQAHKKNMSLYQMAMSVITQLRLGGRGYAPDPNSRLLEHVKGLGLLTDFMNKLQQHLEDMQSVRGSVLRVIGMIKRSLIGCKTQRYPRDVVEEVADGIEKDLEQLEKKLQSSKALISPDKPACKGGSLTSRRPRRLLMYYLDVCSSSLWGCETSDLHTWLYDIPYGPHTPSRFPCVLSQFRSPAFSYLSPENGKALKKKLEEKRKALTVSTNLIPEEEDTYVPLLQRCIKHVTDTVIVIPSKTIVHPAESTVSFKAQTGPSNEGSGKENNSVPSPARKKTKKAESKRKQQASPLSAQPLGVGVPDKQQDAVRSQAEKPKPAKQGKKCRRRLLPPVKGQQQITSFFRV